GRWSAQPPVQGAGGLDLARVLRSPLQGDPRLRDQWCSGTCPFEQQGTAIRVEIVEPCGAVTPVAVHSGGLTGVFLIRYRDLEDRHGAVAAPHRCHEGMRTAGERPPDHLEVPYPALPVHHGGQRREPAVASFLEDGAN